MDFYKKIFPKKARYAILKMLKFIPDKQMIRFQYWMKLGRRLNLDSPERYTEKVQWYKLFYRNSLMPICVDKYRVREYIDKKGLTNYLVDLYAVYDKPEDIDLSTLPEKFVLKTTNGSHTVVICKDKNKLNQDELVKKVKGFFKQSNSSAGREWPYSQVVPKIIVEELLEDPDSDDGDLNDYKFYCFNGNPEYVFLDVDRFTSHKRNIYDTNWNDLHIESDFPCSDKNHSKPETLNEMLNISKILSQDFPAVRVDLYSIRGKVYFGELTFFPLSGYVQFNPDSFDFEIGRKFVLPTKNKE